MKRYVLFLFLALSLVFAMSCKSTPAPDPVAPVEESPDPGVDEEALGDAAEKDADSDEDLAAEQDDGSDADLAAEPGGNESAEIASAETLSDASAASPQQPANPQASAETASAQPAPGSSAKQRTWPATITVPTAGDSGVARNTGRATIRSLHYEVTSDVGEYDGLSLAAEMEGRFEVYNKLFRFSPTSSQGGLLKVSVFNNRKEYDDYVTRQGGNTRLAAVYLHFTDPAKRELVVYRSGGDTPGLPHQAFIQFFRAFVPNPPLWMWEGFSLYFNSLRLTSGGSGEPVVLGLADNLSWVKTIQAMGNTAPTAADILQMDAGGNLQRGDLLSWSLVSFFLNSNEEYFRTLTESLKVLSPDVSVTAKANGEAVMEHITLWIDAKILEKDYRAYIASCRTFVDLVDEGTKAYKLGDKIKAEASFKNALDQNRDQYTPYYYLGLLAYDARDFAKAESFFQSALQCGADPAMIAYTRGINAYSAGRPRDARTFLEEAAAIAPEQYRAKADELIARLR